MLIKHKNRLTWYGEEITQEKYNEILSVLRNRPAAPDGYAYRLTADLRWEQYECPVEEVEQEQTPEERIAELEEALEMIFAGVTE